MSFTSSLNLETDKRKKNIDKIWKGSVVDAFGQAVQNTPVDKGFAKGSWLIALEADGRLRNSTTPITVDPSKIPEAGQGVSLYSNIPYMERLEYGWSQQQPNGWIRSIERNWSNIVRKQERVHNS